MPASKKAWTSPLISVVILNFNGRAWLPRCLESLAQQTILEKIQIVVADNASTDGSDELARQLTKTFPNETRVVQNGGNLGYCAGNNHGARVATGNYLLFLNTDTWLEPDCLEKLLEHAESANADCASPLVLNYEDTSFQGNGASGFDIFGCLTASKNPLKAGRIFGAPGCALLVKADKFQRLGGFDEQFFMYADEADLAWRLTLSGGLSITVLEARVHHRGAVAANPKGGEKMLEFRTTEMVRFFATRNSLLVILKNAQHLLLFLTVTQSLLILTEIIAVLIFTRRLHTIRKTYFRAIADVWRLRHHVANERKRIRKMRKHGDLWMLKFLRPRPGRLADVENLLRRGPPKLSPSKF